VKSVLAALIALTALCFFASAAEDDAAVPHNQDAPPGPALSPAEAVAKMTVPEGFTVEVVAAEPQIMNPVAMTFDERGRIWVTESFEYPRREPGPGRDRIKILEDTDRDGSVDKVTIFAEGLNIPSGIAVGHGGVWVANSPDILFLQDTDGDDKADKQEVVVTGFGRDDTHELPNSLTWGPDGWLYGLNGVFNPAKVEHKGKTYEFTCALFRIHPKTRDFELFCEGTSNPWGVTWDREGSAFISACVIDHLWHLTETGYYIRQGGPYPPFTWPIGSIVDHKHQKAAYCGITYFDSDAYPEQYREKLYMGNIHGACLNCDVLERAGSTYFAKPDPDFLSANDAWFMPVVQKVGPDGCLYVLDWYDRYHCYQDANRDPEGIDRAKGRLYRVRYQETPRAAAFDLAKETDAQLIERLHSPNIYFRDIAQRLLTERGTSRSELAVLVLDDSAPRKARMHALWALVGGGPLDEAFHVTLLHHPDATFRAWGVRAAGNMKQVPATVRDAVAKQADDSSPDVRLQVVIAAPKLDGLDPLPILFQVLQSSGDDELLPHIVWNNLQPLMDERGEEIVDTLAKIDDLDTPALNGLLPYLIQRMVAGKNVDAKQLTRLFAGLHREEPGKAATLRPAGMFLVALTNRVQNREVTGDRLNSLREQMQSRLDGILAQVRSDDGLWQEAMLLSASWNGDSGTAAARRMLSDATTPVEIKGKLLTALISAGDESLAEAARPLLMEQGPDGKELRRQTLGALGRLESPQVGETVLVSYEAMEPELRPAAIELLTSRSAWAKQLIAAIKENRVPREAISVNHVRKLLSSNDQELVDQVIASWGAVRTERNPEREQLIVQMRDVIRATPGDAHRGQKVFTKLCATCHKMYGEGQEIGPDITVNGRSSFEQLLSNVFDPSLVIGSAYQAVTVVTVDGRVLTGLLAENSDQRVVLKQQGGKVETIARADVEEMGVSKLSLMPEDVEKQLNSQEIADLFAYITLDRPPSDPNARQLPGVRLVEPRQSKNAEDFASLIAEVAPGFTTAASGEDGVSLLSEYRGRATVVRTHPLNEESPCVLTSEVSISSDKKSKLLLSVGCDENEGDWQLLVKANGETLLDTIVGPETTENGWAEFALDLSAYAGKPVKLELVNAATGWNYEFAYWGRAAVVSE
jgi:putative membrane-bound dehydrogenase-like protein